MRVSGVTLAMLLTAALPAGAARIDVSNNTYVAVGPNRSLWIDFGVWTYGYNNPGSPYPTSLGLVAPGPDASGRPRATIPGSTAEYFPGFVFEGWLESLDGSVSVPLFDANAARLGMPEGHVLITPGTYTPGASAPLPVAMIIASAWVPVEVSQALFGRDFRATIHLRNAGERFTIGLGEGWTVRGSVFEPDVSGPGGMTTSGVTGRVILENPEPGTWLSAPAGLAVILAATLRRYNSR